VCVCVCVCVCACVCVCVEFSHVVFEMETQVACSRREHWEGYQMPKIILPNLLFLSEASVALG
jgi:hypothetical protein